MTEDGPLPGIYTFNCLRHTTVERVFTFRNPDGSIQNLTGSTFIWFFLPLGASPFSVTSAGTDPKLLLDLANGKVTLYFSNSVIDGYTWNEATHWLQMTDSLNVVSSQIAGLMLIRNP